MNHALTPQTLSPTPYHPRQQPAPHLDATLQRKSFYQPINIVLYLSKTDVSSKKQREISHAIQLYLIQSSLNSYIHSIRNDPEHILSTNTPLRTPTTFNILPTTSIPSPATHHQRLTLMPQTFCLLTNSPSHR